MQAQGIRSFKKVGWKNTLDFEVDHPDHNFFAEGIVVSNSHAASYGYLTAITAYFKANHPKEFFLALLKNAQNEAEPLVEIRKIQKELKYFGIELLPPCLLKGNFDFVIEGSNIRFGLNSIKGLAESALEKLNNFKSADCNKFQMFQAGRQAGLSCGVMASLIMSGALDIFVKESRSKLSFECLLFSKLKEKEKIYVLNNGPAAYFNLIEMVKNILNWTDSQGKKVSRATRLNTLRKESKKYAEIYKNNKENESLAALIWERTLLGFSYSHTLKQIFKNDRPDLITLEEFENNVDPDGVAVCVCFVEDFKEKMSRKGNAMMELFVSDETRNRRFFFAGGSYQEYLEENENAPENNLQKGDIIAIRISKSKDGQMGFVKKLTKQSCKIYVKMAEIKENDDETEILPPANPKPAQNPQFSLNLG